MITDLIEIVGKTNVHTEGEFFDTCCKDATEIVRIPDVVVTVTNPAIIPALIEVATAHQLPIVARGAGTGLSGGALAARKGIVLAFTKLDRIIAIDADKRQVIVEPGVITQAIADQAAELGLFYPPDPASVAESTIGGNVATCAGGLRCKKYGVTKDYVLGVEGYDGEGELVRTGVFTEDETYDLTSLVLGSEGTLLLITKIALQLIDPPQARKTFLVTFSKQDAAAAVVAEILALGIIPSVLEFMDGDAVQCCLDYLETEYNQQREDELLVEPGVAALLLIELDGTPQEIDRDRAIVLSVVTVHQPVRLVETEDDERREYLWTLRRSLSRAVTAAAPLRVSEDVCVPPSRLPELVTSLPVLAEKYDLRVNAYGHAGDGNLHVNFLSNEDSTEAVERIHCAAEELFKMTVRLDGTISGEHGIGICKIDFLPLEVSPVTMEIFSKVKRCFDPKGLINPGKIFT